MKPEENAKAQNPFLAERAPGEPNMRSREAVIDKVDTDKKTVELSFSSDVDLERWHGFYEKLSHDDGAVDLKRMRNGAAALFNHDWDEVVGVIERVWIEGGKGRCVIRFGNSARAQEVWADVRDGIMRNVSVGYEVNAQELTRSDDTGDHYTVTRWSPYEVSIVTVPADITVGVGRSANSQQQTRKEQTMSEPTATAPAPAAAPAAAAAPAPAVVVETRSKSEGPETAQRIALIGRTFHATDEAAQAIADGITVEEFQTRLLERSKKAAAARTDISLGLSEKEAKQFSFARLIAADVAAKTNVGEAKRLMEEAKFELEVVSAAGEKRAKLSGRSPKGLFIPSDILNQRIKLTPEQQEQYQRAVVSVSSTIGNSNVGATYAPTLDTANFAELLRPECLIMNLATMVNGLTGDYEIPKHISGALGGWVGEDGVAPGQNAIFKMIAASPKTVGGVTEITRRALLRSALDLESVIRMDLARGVGQTADLAAYYGTGANGQPTGLTLTDGVKTVAFAGTVSGTDTISPEFTELVQMETVIGQGNVKLDPGSAQYITNVYGRGWAKTRQKFPGTPTGMTLWEPGNTVNGYNVGITNQVSNGHWFLGNWKELFIAMWSGLDILVDPFTNAASGRVRIVALQDLDYLVRRPEAFCFGYK